MARYVTSSFRLLMVTIGLFLMSKAEGQKLDIVSVELIDNRIVIHYDLDDNNPSHEYAISLFSSKDDYKAPLIKVTGDVGNEVKPGSNKAITWDILKELGPFEGALKFEIKAKVFIPFLKLTEFDSERKYKRGRSYPLVWTSGNMSGHVDIELYSEQTRVSSDRNVPNTGKFEWFISTGVKPGGDYYLKFTNTKNRDEVITTQTFRIVTRVPTTLKGLGLLVFGGSVAFISSMSGSSKQGEPNLPLPPSL